jgi:MFS family permease
MTTSSTPKLEPQSEVAREIRRNYRHNAIVNFLDGTSFWFGASFIATRTIIPVFVSNLTDSELVIGLIATISGTGWLLPQLFTAPWVQRLPQKKIMPVRWGIFTERLPVFLMAPTALLATRSPDLALILFLLLLTWHIVGAGVISVGWQEMLAKIIPLKHRGRFFGITNFAGTGMGVLGAEVAKWLLDRYAFPYDYAICFGLAALFIAISWGFLSLTREPPQPTPSPSEAFSMQRYLRGLPEILRADANFRRYMLSQMIIALGGMATGFLTVYAVRQWQLSEGEAGRFTTVMLIGQALCNLLFGWLADHQGHKRVLEIAVLMGVLATVLALLAPAPLWFYGVFALLGGNTAGMILSGIMIVFEFAPPEQRPTYIGLNNTLVGIVAGLAPMIGGWLAGSLGYAVLFGVSGAIGAVGLGVLRWAVKEPRG